MDEETSAKEINLMERNVEAHEREATALKKEAVARSDEVLGHNLDNLYRDLKDYLKEAKQDNDDAEIQRIKTRLKEVQNMRHSMIMNKNYIFLMK